MTDQIQIAPPPVVAVPRAAPVVAPEAVEPARKAQAENKKGDENREDSASSRSSRHLSITRNEDLNAFVYRSIDADSGDVVWQWPSEGVLRRAESYRQSEAAEQHAVDEKA